MIVKTVGRDQNNDIVVIDEKISRTHLQMVHDDNGNVSVVDLGSTNGTYVNGVRIVGETRLNPGDKLLVGDTFLPWQDYFNGAQEATKEFPVAHATNSRRKLMWIIIAGGALLLLLVGGGVLLALNKKHNVEKERIEIEQKRENLEKEVLEADREAAKASAEYEAAKRRAAETRSVEDQQKAEKLRHEMENADKRRMAVKSELDTIKGKLDELKSSLTSETQRATAAEQQRDSLQKQLTKATEAAGKYNIEREKANNTEEQLRLTNEFYVELNKLNNKKLRDLCVYLKLTDAGDNGEKRERIINYFNGHNIDNTERDRIVNKIKELNSTATVVNTVGGNNAIDSNKTQVQDTNKNVSSQK